MSSTIDLSKYKWGDKLPHGAGKYYPMHEAQAKAYNSQARFTAAIAGTGGGKTVIGPLWLSRQIQRVGKKGLYMVVAPTYRVLNRATVPTMVSTFMDTDLQGVYKETKGYYELPHGLGVVWCQGADNPEALEGGQFDGIWIDEGGQIRYQAWVALQKRTGQKRAPIFITTTPYGKNWLFTQFFSNYLKNDPDYCVVQWSSVANPEYPKEEYDRAHRTMSPERAAMEYDGQFSGMKGLVYPTLDTCLVDLNPEEILKKSGKIRGGIDFGWNDPFAAVCGLLDRDDILWIWYERYRSETPIETHAQSLPKFDDRPIMWYCDHNPELLSKLRRSNHRVRRAYKNIIAGIDAVNSRIYSGRLKILKNCCPALLAEGGMYRYPEKDEIVMGDKPVDEDNHAMDALRYLISGLDIKSKDNT